MELLDKAQRWADYDPDPATASRPRAAATAKPWRAWEPP